LLVVDGVAGLTEKSLRFESADVVENETYWVGAEREESLFDEVELESVEEATESDDSLDDDDTSV
jgi:hypothetical protein